MSDAAFSAIEDPNSETIISVVSFWELSMKSVVGKLPLPMPPAELERHAIQEGLEVLPLFVPQIDRFHRLPTTHRDAFDRMLAAIALVNECTIITPDPAFDALGVTRFW